MNVETDFDIRMVTLAQKKLFCTWRKWINFFYSLITGIIVRTTPREYDTKTAVNKLSECCCMWL